MTTSHATHHAKNLRVTQWMPHNANCIVISADVEEEKYTTVQGINGPVTGPAKFNTRVEHTFFGLPKRVTDALMWALACHNETDRQRAEELAERIEQVLSDTNDLEVTFADFGLAVACDLLGIEADEIYAARRQEKKGAAA